MPTLAVSLVRADGTSRNDVPRDLEAYNAHLAAFDNRGAAKGTP